MRRENRRFLWLLDDWDTLAHSDDTSLRLIQEALRCGLTNYIVHRAGVRLTQEGLWFDALRVEGCGLSREKETWRLGKTNPLRIDEVDAIQFRLDAPFDGTFQNLAHMIDFGVRRAVQMGQVQEVEVVNPFEVIVGHNDKIETLWPDHHVVESLITSSRDHLLQFVREHETVVVKPLDQMLGVGVSLVRWNHDQENSVILSDLCSLSHNFRRPVMLQRYMPEVTGGEIRMWFLDGRLLSSVRKFPLFGDFRVDVDAGSRVEMYELDSVSQALSISLGERLVERKIRLAAVDSIGGIVTDFNALVPGMIPMIENLSGLNLAGEIVSALRRPLNTHGHDVP